MSMENDFFTGGLTSSLMGYAIDGTTTINVLNTGDFGFGHTGLLELTLSKDGITSKLGTGGADFNMGSIAKAMNGISNVRENSRINKLTEEQFAGKTEIGNALRMQYGFGDSTQLTNLEDILSGKTKLELGGTDGKAQTVSDGTNKTIYMNMTDGMDWKELGLVLGHEAYRDGVKGTKEEQRKETQSAVNGHTEMAKAMLGDYLYAEDMSKMIAGNENLQMDLFASSLGKDVFEKYVDKAYDSSADYWKQVIQSDGSTKWREDGSLDFTLEDGTVISAEDMKSTIEDIINGRTDPNGKVLKDASKENNKDFQKIINQFFEGNSTGNFKDILNNINSFVNGTAAFADASIAAKLLMGKDGLSQTNINSLNAALYAAQESGLLVKNPYTAVAKTGLIGSGTVVNPYLPLTGNVELTCLSGYRFVTEDFYNSLKEDSRENFPLNNFAKNEHIHTDLISDNFNIVTSVDGAIKLNYDDTWGLNGTNYSTDGYTAFLSNHMDPSSIKNYISLFGMEGTSMQQAGNGSYYMNGIKAGSIYGQMGQTGISGGKHVDFGIYQTKNPYRLNIYTDTRVNFESLFEIKNENNQNGYEYKLDQWANNYSGLREKDYFNSNILTYLREYWYRQPNYSGVNR